MDQSNQPGAQAGTGAAIDTPAAGAAAGAAPSAQPATERTFTQADVDRLVAERLQRERSKFADYDSVKSELAKLKSANALRDLREQVASDKKVPAALLTGDTKEACEQQADAILAFANTAKPAPVVPDGGEVHAASGGKTRDQFAEWFSQAIGQ